MVLRCLGRCVRRCQLLVEQQRLLALHTKSRGSAVWPFINRQFHVHDIGGAEGGLSSRTVGERCAKQYYTSRTLAASSSQIETIPLAQTGEGIKECELIEWYVQEGSEVTEFDRLCEVQSDKASVEITSRFAGMVRRLHHQPGDMVQVGCPLVDVEVAGGHQPPEAGSLTDAPVAGAERYLPAPGENTAPECTTSSAHPRDVKQTTKGLPSAGEKPSASPAVRAIARQHRVPLTEVAGTGPQGRITKEDVHAYLRAHSNGHASAPPAATQADAAGRAAVGGLARQGAQDLLLDRRSSTLPLRGYRRAMVQSMTEATAVPHFHFCDEVRMGPLLRARSAAMAARPDGLRLTFLPFVLKAISLALQDWPLLNSSLAEGHHEVLQHAAHNLGVAMATPLGLVVPNVKGVESRSIADIAVELVRLQALAQEGHLPPADLAGGTLTVSNIGAIGGTYAMPLVHAPEVAIVALGRVRMVAHAKACGEPSMEPTMAIGWGADHRVVDGAMLAQFSNYWKSMLECPDQMLLQLR